MVEGRMFYWGLDYVSLHARSSSEQYYQGQVEALFQSISFDNVSPEASLGLLRPRGVVEITPLMLRVVVSGADRL